MELAAEIISLRPKMRIILCTGFSERISKEGIRSIGIRELLMKPIAMKELIKSARRVLDEQV
jgi:response regulator RpfG family c-di-GMP phosphodiesterase